ncbi:MAG TPA: DUF1800 domain-containing protein [Bryobacteraceae bacterium]|nr:DUF1800 domain-containing protein [Bryobacteraceae bacterium]
MDREVPFRSTKILVAIVLLVLCPLVLAKDKKPPKKIKASQNPPQYAAFAKPLPQTDKLHQALDRLTFGPHPGDLQTLEQTGLLKWIEMELHPERVPENPILMQRLEPLASLGMNIHDTYTHFPPPQMIIAVARGKAPLPDDPELRAIVVRLADRYLEKRNEAVSATAVRSPVTQLPGAPGVLNSNLPTDVQKAVESKAQDPNDDSDLDLKVKLETILTPDQINVLRNGKPAEKRALLENLPADKRTNFVWALRPKQRQQLIAMAPVELRRELMLSVNPQGVVTNDLTEGKLLRAIYSNHQLEELLLDFWFNHFNVFINKGSDRFTVPTYEREAIRPYVFGKFYDLLLATAKSPAMLFYLDNWQSEGADSQANRPRPFAAKPQPKRGLNENYGRELMELHTLGVDGGYTQQDVINAARCFTGWTIAGPRKGGGFEYNDKMHDKGEKVVLGHVIRAGGGMNDGIEVLQILAHHPSTAHFISLQLARRFVADDPPPSLVNRMADTFLRTDGDLRELTRMMIESPEFWSEGAYRAKVKTPFEMVVSAVRATNGDVTSAFLLGQELNKLGEPLYRKIEPTGYSNANAEWISSAALLDRMNFALALAHNRVPGIKVDVAQWQTVSAQNPMALARQILQQDPSEQTQSAIQKALNDPELQKQLAQNAKAGPPQVPSLIAGLVIGSPEFQRR